MELKIDFTLDQYVNQMFANTSVTLNPTFLLYDQSI
jgi:hypothetical protein